MRNVIILGSGRSGTSMVAGTLAKAGYFMGEHLWEARDANPKGFFEDKEINGINEDILAPLIPDRLHLPAIRKLRIPEKVFFRNRPIRGQRWLASIPLDQQITSSESIQSRIKAVVQHPPYCFKDPRFSYTLHLWRPYLTDVVFICVFRDPASTALSILKECHTLPKLRHPIKGIRISRRQVINLWTLMYEHILLKHYCSKENWLFLHYNQVIAGEGLKKLAELTQAQIDLSFPDANIRRSYAEEKIPQKTLTLYQRLCALATYQETELVK